MIQSKNGNRSEFLDATQKLAVLIDADNAQASVIEGLLAEVSLYGEATVKRIYGDFTATNSKGWKAVLQEHAIKPVQQFAYTTGKNATDSTMIIDAMDLLYTRRFNGFCIVSSDSDFTGLALRIREEGLMVYGFGEEKTPDAFRKACHKFIFTEVLRPASAPDVTPETQEKVSPKDTMTTAKPAKQAKPTTRPFPKKFVLQALEQALDDSGWAHIGTFGSFLVKLQPDFDSRLYGYKKLSELVKAKTDVFQYEERPIHGSEGKVVYLRAKS
jgi:uncharacterized LabA/DUF88 family protein